MENEIAGKILKRVGNEDLLDILTKKLSFSELNSLLLEVYKMRSEDLAPDELLNMYISNRFVKPALEDAIELLQLQLDILKISSALSFIPIELSPVAPLGACSAVATANQNKIISALRGTEVLADATNSLALHICHMKREMKVNDGAGGTVDRMRYCTVHRHVRAQKFNNPRSFPHFKLFCMVTSGRDSGSYLFEKGSLLEYFNLYKTVFSQLAGIDNLKYKIFKVGGYTDSDGFIKRLEEYIIENFDGDIEFIEDPGRLTNQYYKGLQFKIYLKVDGKEYEAADGGFVDWSQKLLQNKKERMAVSGFGIGLLLKLMKDKT